MKILEMKTNNYRNLKGNTLAFSEGINFICGENAQGKTNIIEALWMFTGTRSFRGVKDEFLVGFEETNAGLDGRFFLENREQEISVYFADGKRAAFLNGIRQNYPTNIIGKFRAVLFSPMQLSLIKGAPETRRKFLDAAICQLKPTYTALLIRYNQILRHRNALLKRVLQKKERVEALSVWDDKLTASGSLIIKQRLEYLSFLKEHAQKIYEEISNNKETLESTYSSSLLKKDNNETIAQTLKTKLEKTRENDIKTGTTSAGPHKDDLVFSLDGKSTKLFGSQGQQRSFALALKLAEAAMLEEKTGDAPVVLLDDVMSELDLSRQNYLLNKIKNWQVFITSCDESLAKNIKEGKIFKVEQGKIIKEKECS